MSASALGTLTNRDREILDALTMRVRVLAVSQVAATWWADTRHAQANARRRLVQLSDAGLVECFAMLAAPLLPLTEPVCAWQPGNPDPDFGAAAYRLKSRWTRPAIPTLSVVATAAAGNRFGGKGGRKPRGTEQTHDLHLAAVFLLKRQQQPEMIRHWVSEAGITAASEYADEKLPDAMLLRPRKTAIEFGGRYGKPKLEAFHAYCRNHALPYEVW